MLDYVWFKFVRLLYYFADFFLRVLFRYSLTKGWSSERKTSAEFENSAHVTRVLMKGRKIELEGARIPNFILRHEHYCHPDIVLKDPSITLLTVDENSAIFVDCGDIDVHDHINCGPFFYINQFNHCKKLIQIPIKHFAKMMEDNLESSPTSDVNLILLSNTGRCGSTLLTQLFEKAIPGTVSISEPECLLPFVAGNTVSVTKMKDRRKLLRACIEVLCITAINRKLKDGVKNINYVVIKPKAHAIGLTTELAELYPAMQHLYLYRHPVEYLRSILAIFNSLLHPVLQELVMKLSIKMNMEGFLMSHFPTQKNSTIQHVIDNYDVNNTSIGMSALFCSNMISIREQAKAAGFPVKAVSYHELVANPGPAMKKVIAFCGINADAADAENHLPTSDSQNKSEVLSRSNLMKFKNEVSPEEASNLDMVLEACGLPVSSKFPMQAAELAKTLGWDTE